MYRCPSHTQARGKAVEREYREIELEPGREIELELELEREYREIELER
jgi:hypothetical protein